MDETGRTDMAGHPVGFYPSARESGKPGTQQSAMKAGLAAKPPKNAQENPFFVDPIKQSQQPPR